VNEIPGQSHTIDHLKNTGSIQLEKQTWKYANRDIKNEKSVVSLVHQAIALVVVVLMGIICRVAIIFPSRPGRRGLRR
jgi:hypothetical protein